MYLHLNAKHLCKKENVINKIKKKKTMKTNINNYEILHKSLM